MDPAKGETEANELLQVIRHEIDMAANTTESILGDLVIDAESLEIQGEESNINDRILALNDYFSTE